MDNDYGRNNDKDIKTLKLMILYFSWRQIHALANHQMREKAALKHFSPGYLGDQGIKGNLPN